MKRLESIVKVVKETCITQGVSKTIGQIMFLNSSKLCEIENNAIDYTIVVILY